MLRFHFISVSVNLHILQLKSVSFYLPFSRSFPLIKFHVRDALARRSFFFYRKILNSCQCFRRSPQVDVRWASGLIGDEEARKVLNFSNQVEGPSRSTKFFFYQFFCVYQSFISKKGCSVESKSFSVYFYFSLPKFSLSHFCGGIVIAFHSSNIKKKNI